MTFEEWWEQSGKAQIRALSHLPARSYADVEETLRTAALAGWKGAAQKTQSTFDAWFEMHTSECTKNVRFCFALCWNTALRTAQDWMDAPTPTENVDGVKFRSLFAKDKP
jgi:hypothetical protein